jgi:hypothetical protein
MTTGQRTYPHLSLPVRLIHLLIACPTFLDKPTLARSLCAMSPSIDIDNIRLFVGGVNGALPDSAKLSLADLSSSAAEFVVV